ncbi:formate transporter FocA [Shewanella youngdeokensis]|uniref:Formate transporter FocA n=1 Tax=Shewanella youngdeokensis TaxID=2999068 RepID=A0ABZ0JWQ7_9GAMM|nr:formate transporter FocA [Shewanella sp. DAU334]
MNNQQTSNLVNKTTTNNNAKFVEANTLTQHAQNFGADKVTKGAWKSFGLAIFAGAFIAMAFVFYITVTTGSQNSWGITRLIGGMAFSLGLILVVVCGGELFTSTVLSCVAWVEKKVSTPEVIKCWGRVYIGNILGALLMVLLIMAAGMYQLDSGRWGLSALNIAQHKLHHSWTQAFVLGMLCNMLVCLGVWMTFTTKDILTKALLLILPVAMFVSSGFEHSIANLFMVPLGISIYQFADASWFAAMNIDPAQYADLTVAGFVLNNLIPVTLGNIVGGGVVIGLGYWFTEKVDSQTLPSNNAGVIKTNQQIKVRTQEANLQSIKALLKPTPVQLFADTALYQALAKLTQYGVTGAPVVNEQQQLIGYICGQDILESLNKQTVGEIMFTDVLTASPDDNLITLVGGLMHLNHSQMVNELTLNSKIGLNGVAKQDLFPIIDSGILCGVVSRADIAQQLRLQ